MTQKLNNIYALIPARGGSKRLLGKNIYPVLGKAMVLYTIEAAKNSKYLLEDNLYVSTDDFKIKETVAPYVKIIDRPDELAGDKVWTQDVVNHFAKHLGLSNEDIVIILQANSPQITGELIDRCIKMFLDNKLWQVHTVDQSYINNGAIQIMYVKVSEHKGKANYNGVVVTDIIDVHTFEDVQLLEKRMKDGTRKGN